MLADERALIPPRMLQVFGPTAITREINEAESRFNEALSTRHYGRNRRPLGLFSASASADSLRPS
jgi:hypothetical protein